MIVKYIIYSNIIAFLCGDSIEKYLSLIKNSKFLFNGPSTYLIDAFQKKFCLDLF